jgi:phage-related tail fiber protein
MSTATDRQGVNNEVAFKPPVRVATTGAITLSGLQTIDGVALADSDRVLVKDQADQTTNGLYSATTGDWPRTLDCNGNRDIVKGSLVFVNEGSTLTKTIWAVTASDPITIDSTNITWTRIV